MPSTLTTQTPSLLKSTRTKRMRKNDAFYNAKLTINDLHLRMKDGDNYHFIPSIIANCAILVEGTVNDGFVSFFEMRKKRHYAKPLDSLLRLPFNVKFPLLPLLLSDWKYQWNTKSELVMKVEELMRIRNNMLHAHHPPLEVPVYEYDNMTMAEYESYPYYGKGKKKDKMTPEEVQEWIDTAYVFNSRFETLALNLQRKDFERMKQRACLLPLE